MAISKSTPYVRYKKDFTSSLHLGTIHIESEYLDRTQKTTIESIHGMTWHNKVVNENKELNLLSDTQLELTDLEKQYWNTGEKCVSVDEIHTLEEVEPNEDGTYTYTVNSMEGEYIEIYDGINNITSTSDGLDGQFEIVYDTTEEDINGNIALDQVVSQYEITDSGVGAITGAKSTGLTLVNHITESSKDEVVAIEQQEGEHFTINNTVQGNIKSATLKGNTLVNLSKVSSHDFAQGRTPIYDLAQPMKANTTYTIFINVTLTGGLGIFLRFGKNAEGGYTQYRNFTNVGLYKFTVTPVMEYTQLAPYIQLSDYNAGIYGKYDNLVIIEGDYTNQDIPYFTGMQSVKMPVLTTTGKNLYPYGNVNFTSSHDNWHDAKGTPGMWGDVGSKSKTRFLLKKGTYTFSADFNTIENIEFFSIVTDSEESVYNSNDRDTIVLTQDTYLTLRLKTVEVDTPVILNNIQIEESSSATSYEPYKSNILTTNEEVELRGIGEVKDELNVVTGEFTQRIGEVVLDGSDDEEWWYAGHSDTIIRCNTTINIKWKTQILCADIQVDTPNIGTTPYQYEGIANHLENYIYLYLKTEKIENYSDDSTNEDKLAMVRDWLSKNPITIQYQLATESVKTVDLTVQNQDGNTIPRMQTQQGITHVSTSSDGLTPVVEMSCSYDTIIKPNTTYTIKLDRPIVSDTMYLQVDLGGTMMMLDADVNAFTIKTPSTLSHSQLRLSGTGNTVKEIIVLEGNRVNDKIEYFEGMKNVENPILVVSNCQYVFGKGGRK